MNTIELFEAADFQGESVFVDKDIADLKDVAFYRRAQSFKIKGDPWIIFSEIGYKGKFSCFKAGDYSSIPAQEVTSVRMVKDGVNSPKITLYEDVNYHGKPVTLEKPVSSLKSYGFDNMVLSHKVVSGAWVLYSKEHYGGDQLVTVNGEAFADCSQHGLDKISSVKPIQA